MFNFKQRIETFFSLFFPGGSPPPEIVWYKNGERGDFNVIYTPATNKVKNGERGDLNVIYTPATNKVKNGEHGDFNVIYTPATTKLFLNITKIWLKKCYYKKMFIIFNNYPFHCS